MVFFAELISLRGVQHQENLCQNYGDGGGTEWLDKGIIGSVQSCFFEQSVLLA